MKSDYITYASPKAYKSPSTTHKTPPSAAGSSGADYKCHLCNFSTNRLNVIVLHNKIHSSEKKNIAELSGNYFFVQIFLFAEVFPYSKMVIWCVFILGSRTIFFPIY